MGVTLWLMWMCFVVSKMLLFHMAWEWIFIYLCNNHAIESSLDVNECQQNWWMLLKTLTKHIGTRHHSSHTYQLGVSLTIYVGRTGLVMWCGVVMVCCWHACYAVVHFSCYLVLESLSHLLRMAVPWSLDLQSSCHYIRLWPSGELHLWQCNNIICDCWNLALQIFHYHLSFCKTLLQWNIIKSQTW